MTKKKDHMVKIRIGNSTYVIKPLTLKESMELDRSIVEKGLVEAPFKITREALDNLPAYVLKTLSVKIAAITIGPQVNIQPVEKANRMIV